jgi:hypothetical protein
MKSLMILLILTLSSCSSAKLKKCQPSVDPTLMQCSKRVQGQYYMCEKPVGVLSCQDPQ